MGALFPIFAAASVSATAVWLVVRITNRRPFVLGLVPLVPILAVAALFSDLRDDFLATLNRVIPWLLVIGGALALLCSALMYQAYVDFVSRVLRSERFCRWASQACGPRFVDKAHLEWKKWEVVTPARVWINTCGSLVFIAAGAVWMALN